MAKTTDEAPADGRDEAQPPTPPAPAPGPAGGDHKLAEALDGLAATMKDLREKSEGKPAEPDRSIFEPRKGHHIIDAMGRRVAHKDGDPVFLDDKLRPIPAEG